MIEFFLNELLYLVLVLLLLLSIAVITKKPKANKVFFIVVVIVSFHSLIYFTLLLVSSDSIWYPDLIRIKSTPVKYGIDLGFGNFIINVLVIYLTNIICLTLALIGFFRVNNRDKLY